MEQFIGIPLLINNKRRLKLKQTEAGIYIHLPFCPKKCDYCDFISYPNQYHQQEKYITNVIQEIKAQKELLKQKEITTIYFGGGTPSSIESKWIQKVLSELKTILGENKQREITLEINPGTVTKEKLLDYHKAGINRLSIGLQSAEDTLLTRIGRIHTWNDFKQTIQLISKIGFTNYNVDLMIGLPNQSIENIKTSIDQVLNLPLKPNHLSVYSLIVEEGTPIASQLEKGSITLPEEEEERLQYHYVKNRLELAGYTHYEISNFAKEGYQSKHNTNCWEQKEYFGFGVAAHSYLEGVRFSNTEDLEEYLAQNKNDWENQKIEKWIHSIDETKPFPQTRGIRTIHEKQTQKEQEKEYIMLGLRMLKGISISAFKEKFGQNPLYLFHQQWAGLVKEELIEVDLDQIRLTSKGLDLANLVWEEFI